MLGINEGVIFDIIRKYLYSNFCHLIKVLLRLYKLRNLMSLNLTSETGCGMNECKTAK
jgi:hypothetical protein